MATAQSILSNAQCTVCSGNASLFETLLMGVLQELTPMTQAEIQAASGCWTCYGISQSEAAILVLLNSLVTGGGSGGGIIQAQSGNYGGGEPNWIPTTGFGFAWDTSTDPDTEWNYHDGAWH